MCLEYNDKSHIWNITQHQDCGPEQKDLCQYTQF